MSQHYPDPRSIWVPERRLEDVQIGRRDRKLQAILTKDGQIVPLLVRRIVGVNGDAFVVANDANQAKRLGALEALGFPTVLVETKWGRDDL
jgi:hypothetical protein